MEPYTEEIERPSIWEFRLTSHALSGSDARMASRPDSDRLAADLRVVGQDGAPAAGAVGGWSREGILEALLAEPTDTWRTIPGRVTFPWRQGDADPGGRGSVIKRFDTARGLRGRWAADPARREFEALRRLRDLGLPVPEPVLHAQSVSLGRSMLIMDEVRHTRSLRQAIAADDDPLARAHAEGVRLAALVGELHGSGWYHRDLYLQHVVEREGDGALVLLDLGRARHQRQPRPRWFHKDLAALHVSAGAAYRDALLGALLPEYFRARQLPVADLAAWERAILRRSARVGARIPRHGDPGTREGETVEGEVDDRFLPGG